MKILILGSVALPVPPPMQGGTERIAYWQAMGLSARNHDITLVAAKGSTPNPAYKLVEIGGGDTVEGSKLKVESRKSKVEFTEGSRNLRKEAIYLAQVEQYILDHGKEYDVILNNMRAGETLFVPAARAVGVPYATVMHLPMFTELADFFTQTNTAVITISNAQRAGFDSDSIGVDGLNYAGTVYNCVEPRLLAQERSNGGQAEYLLMMGSIAPHKNQKDGILAAKSLNKKIILAGKIGNQAYFDTEIKPYISDTVVHVGEMGLSEKIELLCGAEALLFPIVWPEPFGLVMIEAMAVGTPVVAYRNGAVSEVVVDGKTGFIVENGKLVEGIQKLGDIDRLACRKHVEDHFTVDKMIDSLELALKNVVLRR